MREILTGLGIGLVVAWILERLPQLALVLVRLAARLMPTPELREQMRDDWTADVMTADGPLSMLMTSLSTLIHVPSIRQSYGYPAVKFEVAGDLLFRVALLGAVATQIVIFILGSGLILYIGALMYLPGYISAEDRLVLMALMVDAKEPLGTLQYTVPITLILFFLRHFVKSRGAPRT